MDFKLVPGSRFRREPRLPQVLPKRQRRLSPVQVSFCKIGTGRDAGYADELSTA